MKIIILGILCMHLVAVNAAAQNMKDTVSVQIKEQASKRLMPHVVNATSISQAVDVTWRLELTTKPILWTDQILTIMVMRMLRMDFA